MTRISTNQKIGIILVILFFVLVFVDMLVIEPNNLKITSNAFDILDGNKSRMRIVFISDIHIGQQRAGYLEEVVEKINAQNPDIVFLGGDSIDWSESELPMLEPLENLSAKYGIYAVLGNHDYGLWGCRASSSLGDNVEKKLESMDITVLRNENRVINSNGTEFAIIGLDDEWMCRDDYRNVSKGLGSVPKIVLVHNLRAIEGEQLNGKNLILSGHTHCGHIRVPILTDIIIPSSGFGKVIGGRERLNENTEAYVTCGVTSGIVRLLTNPEISVIDIE